MTEQWLSDDELAAMDLAGDLAAALGRIIGDGPTRAGDLRELTGYIHAIQQAVLSQAAARFYPDRFRLLGDVLK